MSGSSLSPNYTKAGVLRSSLAVVRQPAGTATTTRAREHVICRPENAVDCERESTHSNTHGDVLKAVFAVPIATLTDRYVFNPLFSRLARLEALGVRGLQTHHAHAHAFLVRYKTGAFSIRLTQSMLQS